MLFQLPCQIARSAPPTAALGARCELILELFPEVPWRVLVFQTTLMRCATELVVADRRERWALVFSAWEVLSLKRKLVSIAFFDPWTCTVGSPLVSTCCLNLLRVQYSKRILC